VIIYIYVKVHLIYGLYGKLKTYVKQYSDKLHFA